MDAFLRNIYSTNKIAISLKENNSLFTKHDNYQRGKSEINNSNSQNKINFKLGELDDALK